MAPKTEEQSVAVIGALQSEDSNVIKSIRGSQKGVLTRHLNTLKQILVLQDGSDLLYDLDKINQPKVEFLYNEAKSAYRNAVNLHERYLLKRNDTDLLVDTDTNCELYIGGVEKSFQEVVELYGNFRDQFNKDQGVKASRSSSVSMNSLEEKKVMFEFKKREYETVAALVEKFIISEEADKHLTAGLHRDLLSQAFVSLDSVGQEIALLLSQIVPEPDTQEKEKFDCPKIRIKYHEYLLSIGKIIKVHEASVGSVTASVGLVTGEATASSSYLKLKKFEVRHFSGQRREYSAWKRDFREIVVVPGRPDSEIGFTLKSSIPQKYHYLFDNISLAEHSKMFTILDEKFGKARLIIDETVAEMERIKPVTNDKEFVIFVDKIEKIYRDLNELSLTSEIQNASVLSKLEQKLPYLVRRDWIIKVSDESFDSKSPTEISEEFLSFLKKTKKQVEYDNSEGRSGGQHGKGKTFKSFTMGELETKSPHPQFRNHEPKRESAMAPCIACNDGLTDLKSTMHRMSTCEVFKNTPVKELLARCKCKKCPFATDDHIFSTCKRKIRCHNCKEFDHHGLLCPKPRKNDKSKNNTSITKTNYVNSKEDAGNSLLPVMCQAQFVKVLSSDKKFSLSLGSVFDTYSTDNYITHKFAKKLGYVGRDRLLSVEGFNKIKTTFETALYTVVLVDLQGNRHEYECYGTDEITSPEDLPNFASYKKLCQRFDVSPNDVKRPKHINLLISMRESGDHPVKLKTIGQMSLFQSCYGKTFGGCDASLSFTPHVSCYYSNAVEVCDGSASSRVLKAVVKEATQQRSKSIDQQFLDYCEDDSIGIHCYPACGSCKCGQCISGSKSMSLKDERAYASFAKNLTFVEEGSPSKAGPHYVTSLPWKSEKHRGDLPNNKVAVLGVMNATKKKLKLDPVWEETYDAQLKALIEKDYAREISDKELHDWVDQGNQIYYIAHQMVVQPESASTPIRVVFNSSQVYQGHSLNNALELGPDILNSLHGVLMRFRGSVCAAQGDVSKMFYMVKLTLPDQMMQLFVWKFKGETKIRTFCMTGLVMGNRPSTNISIIAMRLNASRGNNKIDYPIAHEALTTNSYVDNTFCGAENDEDLEKAIEQTELVANSAGFHYKEWQRSGVGGSESVLLATGSTDASVEKALGLMWNTSADELFVRVDLAKPPKKVHGKEKFSIHVDPLGAYPTPPTQGTDPVNASAPEEHSSTPLPSDPVHLSSRRWHDDQLEEGNGQGRGEATLSSSSLSESVPVYDPSLSPTFRVTIKPNLTLRAALSIHMKPYDPLGFILPTRMIGSLLLRKTIQMLKKGVKGPVPWDDVIEGDISQKWFDYFSMLAAINEVRFPRSYKPKNVNKVILPDLALFDDGNPDSYGCNAYIRWTLNTGKRECRLLMSKAKLSAILHKGDSFRNELCGATCSARLREWICEETKIQFNKFFHFLDSAIVQAMIHRDSYGFNTFAGLRIGEIQKKSNPNEWLHIPSDQNIADILTRGASPCSLLQGSLWQCGPSWLVEDEDKWPVSTVQQMSGVVDKAEIEKYEVGPKIGSKVKKSVGKCVFKQDLSTVAVIDINLLSSRISSLQKVLRIVAYVLRWIFKYDKAPHGHCMNRLAVKEINYNNIPPVSASEISDAWKVAVALAQQDLTDKDVRRLVPSKNLIKLENYEFKFSHIVLGGRVKNIPKTFSQEENIPIIKSGSFAKLVVQYYHNRSHTQVDTVVSFVRNDIWIIGARKLASAFDRKCIDCLRKRQARAEQVMGDLPECRVSEEFPAWSSVNMDLFGPLEVRDEVVKRGPRVCKKIWGIIFVCTRTRGVYLDVASDYSTESVLHAVRRLLALKGNVRLIISDRGSQLLAAEKELKSWREGWDEKDLIRFGATKHLEWQFVMPASQHQNGSAEVMIKYIKGIKNSYLRALGDVKLTYNETYTMMLEVANLCNERPIGLKPNEDSDPCYLSPNSLFLGRSSDRISGGPFMPAHDWMEDNKQLKSRFLLVQSLTDKFWDVWTDIYFPSLLVRQKWHVQYRSLRVGDVCFLRDRNTLRGEWRLARVTDVYPDKKGVVRNVRVKVCNADSKPNYASSAQYLRRHVSNLIVIIPVEEQDSAEVKY